MTFGERVINRTRSVISNLGGGNVGGYDANVNACSAKRFEFKYLFLGGRDYEPA